MQLNCRIVWRRSPQGDGQLARLSDEQGGTSGLGSGLRRCQPRSGIRCCCALQQQGGENTLLLQPCQQAGRRSIQLCVRRGVAEEARRLVAERPTPSRPPGEG